MQDTEIQDRLRSIRAVVSSVSGVLHNNQDIIGQVMGKRFNLNGEYIGELRGNFQGLLRSHYDGQGVSLLRAIGIQVCFVTVDPILETDPIARMIERWNVDLPSSLIWPLVRLIGGVVGKDQIKPVADWCTSREIFIGECAVMGHDLVQVPLMQAAASIGALLVAPAQAEEVVKKMSHLVTARPGGNGALRDFANMVIEARGIDPTTLPTR